MRNDDLAKLLAGQIKDQNTKKKLENLLNTNDGRDLAMNLSKMASNNPNVANALNFASKGDLNSAKNQLQGMMNTKEGRELYSKLSKIIGG